MNDTTQKQVPEKEVAQSHHSLPHYKSLAQEHPYPLTHTPFILQAASYCAVLRLKNRQAAYGQLEKEIK